MTGARKPRRSNMSWLDDITKWSDLSGSPIKCAAQSNSRQWTSPGHLRSWPSCTSTVSCDVTWHDTLIWRKLWAPFIWLWFWPKNHLSPFQIKIELFQEYTRSIRRMNFEALFMRISPVAWLNKLIAIDLYIQCRLYCLIGNRPTVVAEIQKKCIRRVTGNWLIDLCFVYKTAADQRRQLL